MDDLDGMARNVLGIWVDTCKSVTVIQIRSREWYSPEDDQNALGEALALLNDSLHTTQLHLTRYYNFNQQIPDYLHFPTSETILIKLRYEDLEQWTYDIQRYRRDIEINRRNLFKKTASYATKLRLSPAPGGDSERCARAVAVEETLKISLFMNWQRRKDNEIDRLAEARAQASNLAGPGGATRVPSLQAPMFVDQEHPYAPIYDKISAAVELTERIAQHSPPDPDRIPAWRTITTCMRLFHNLFFEGDSERLRNVVWRFGHSVADFHNQGLQAGEWHLLKEFVEPMDMVIEAVRMFSLTGFTGK